MPCCPARPDDVHWQACPACLSAAGVLRLHEISAAGDQNDYDEALTVAGAVRLPDDYPPTRAAHFWIDKARAETWTARQDEAPASLQSAVRLASTHPLPPLGARDSGDAAACATARERGASGLRALVRRIAFISTSVKDCGVDASVNATPLSCRHDESASKDPGDRVSGTGGDQR